MENNNLKRVTIYEYMQLCRERRLIQVKQTPFIEHIGIYIKDSKVYKIVLQAYRETLNKSKKVGLGSWFTIITENLPQNLLICPTEVYDKNNKIPCDISKGFYVLYYSLKTREFKIYSGER